MQEVLIGLGFSLNSAGWSSPRFAATCCHLVVVSEPSLLWRKAAGEPTWNLYSLNLDRKTLRSLWPTLTVQPTPHILFWNASRRRRHPCGFWGSWVHRRRHFFQEHNRAQSPWHNGTAARWDKTMACPCLACTASHVTQDDHASSQAGPPASDHLHHHLHHHLNHRQAFHPHLSSASELSTSNFWTAHDLWSHLISYSGQLSHSEPSLPL